MDFRGVDPRGAPDNTISDYAAFLDTTIFGFGYGDESVGDRLIDAQIATSTLYSSTTMLGRDDVMFGVNFADGRIKGYPLRRHVNAIQKCHRLRKAGMSPRALTVAQPDRA